MKIKFNNEKTEITDIWLDGCTISIANGAVVPLEFADPSAKKICELNGLFNRDIHIVPIKISNSDLLVDNFEETWFPIGAYNINGERSFLQFRVNNSYIPLEKLHGVREGDPVEINMSVKVWVMAPTRNYFTEAIIHMTCSAYQQSIADEMLSFEVAVDRLVNIAYQEVEVEE